MSLKNLSKTEKIILVIIAFSLFGRLAFLPFIQGVWWDEAVYLTLGRNIHSGIYSLDPVYFFETERPPLVPILVSLSSESIIFSRLFLSALSILGVVATYYLTKEIFGRKAAIWSSLFLSTAPFFLFFTLKILSEGVFILFLSLSALFFVRGLKQDKIIYYMGSGIFAALTVLARHFGVLLIIGYFFTLLYLLFAKKQKKYLTYVLVIFIFSSVSISPWLILTSKYYSNPLDAFFAKFSHVSGAYNYSLPNTAIDYFSVWYLSGIFLIAGLFYILKGKVDKVKAFCLLIFVMSVVFYILLPGYKEPRYLLGFLPLVSAIAGFGIVKTVEKRKTLKKLLPIIAIVVCLISVTVIFQSIWNDRIAAKESVDAALYLKNIGEKGDIVMTLHYPYIYYISGKRAVFLTRDPDYISKDIKEKNVKYILVYKEDSRHPGYGFFNNKPEFIKLAAFGQAWDPQLAILYKVA